MTELLARDPAAPFTIAPVPIGRARRAVRPERGLLITAGVLATIGAVLVWSATRARLGAEGANPQTYLYKHVFNMIMGAALLFAASRIDARLIRMVGPILYVGSIVGLLAVFAVGTTVNGAHAWIHLGGGFDIQPSEFMKLGLIVGMAVWFAQRAAERVPGTPPQRGEVVVALVMMVVPLGLILLQPDLGSAMVLSAAGYGVLIAARVRARWTIGLIVLGILGAVFIVKAGMLADYQIDRFKAFTNPTVDPQGAAYNVTQAHIAVANGGVFGKGLFHGPQTRGAFVPEQQTDFVYSVAGEEFGLLGAGFIIVLFGILCWRGMRIAAQADPVGRLIAVGIVCWFGFQAFENIGMNLGLTPVTGIPLPFVSYGGSSMFAQSLALGLLYAVHRSSLS